MSFFFFFPGRLGEATIQHSMKYVGFAKSAELVDLIQKNIASVWEQERLSGIFALVRCYLVKVCPFSKLPFVRM